MRVAVILFVLFLAGKLGAGEFCFDAIVDHVTDGDSFVVVTLPFEGTKPPTQRVRIADVDAPELGTVEGNEAAVRMRDRIEGRRVELQVVARDAWARMIAVVWIDGVLLRDRGENQK